VTRLLIARLHRVDQVVDSMIGILFLKHFIMINIKVENIKDIMPMTENIDHDKIKEAALMERQSSGNGNLKSSKSLKQ